MSFVTLFRSAKLIINSLIPNILGISSYSIVFFYRIVIYGNVFVIEGIGGIAVA